MLARFYKHKVQRTVQADTLKKAPLINELTGRKKTKRTGNGMERLDYGV
jgi:hypothetical protein